MRAGAHRDALLDEEGANLIDRRRPPRDQSCPHPVQRLLIKLILGLLANAAKIGAQRRLGDRLGIVGVVLLPP